MHERTNKQTVWNGREREKTAKCINIEWYGCFSRFVDRANLIFEDGSGEIAEQANV